MSFDELPRNLQEEIWSYLDEKEFYRLRMVSKGWKENIEQPRSPVLRERYERGKRKSDEWEEGKKFFRGFCYTATFHGTEQIETKMECCYGPTMVITHCPINWCFICCKECCDKSQCLVPKSLCGLILVYPIIMLITLIALLVEFFRFLAWMFTCFFCCTKTDLLLCKCKSVKRRSQPQDYYQGLMYPDHPPFPTIEETYALFQGNPRHFDKLRDNYEEKLDCGSACAICCFGKQTLNPYEQY